MRVGAALCSLICYSDVIRKFWRARLGSKESAGGAPDKALKVAHGLTGTT